jgi:hypothetical protein
MSFSHTHERIYGKLLAPLGGTSSVAAECLFVDPIADIAVLGAPDNQVLGEEADPYEALLESTTPLPISDAPKDGAGWLLSLTGELMPCTVKHIGGPLWIEGAKTKGGIVRFSHARDRCGAVVDAVVHARRCSASKCCLPIPASLAQLLSID